MVSRSALGSRSTKSSQHQLARSFSNTDVATFEKTDGSISDSAIASSTIMTAERKRRPSIGYKVAAFVGFSRKNRSTTQLGTTGKGKHTFYKNTRLLLPIKDLP